MSRCDINFLKLRYEDLVRNANRVQQRVEEFASLKFAISFYDYYKQQHKHAYRYAGRYRAMDASLVRENDQVDESRVSKWKNPEHAAIIRAQFSKHPELFDILVRDGYELDANWFLDMQDLDVRKMQDT